MRQNARGSLTSRGARDLRRARSRPRGCARMPCCLVAEVDRRRSSKKPRPPNANVRNQEANRGGRGERGLRPSDDNRADKSRPWWRASRTKLFAAKLFVANRAGGDEQSNKRRARCATPRGSAWEQLGSKGDEPWGLELRKWMRNRRSKGRSKSSASPVERKASRTGKSFVASRRRGRSGLGDSRRIGTRAPRKNARTGIERESRQRRQRLDRTRRGPGETGSGETLAGNRPGTGRIRPHESRTIRRSDRCVVKRMISGLERQHPLGYTPDEESVTMGRKQMGYGFSLTECWEAETNWTHLASRSSETSQDVPSEGDLA